MDSSTGIGKCRDCEMSLVSMPCIVRRGHASLRQRHSLFGADVRLWCTVTAVCDHSSTPLPPPAVGCWRRAGCGPSRGWPILHSVVEAFGLLGRGSAKLTQQGGSRTGLGPVRPSQKKNRFRQPPTRPPPPTPSRVNPPCYAKETWGCFATLAHLGNT